MDTSTDKAAALFQRLKLGEALPYFSGTTARLDDDRLSDVAKELVRGIEQMRSLKRHEREHSYYIWEEKSEWPCWADQAAALPTSA